MAFVPFVESDQPTMAAFNEKFQQNFDAAVNACAKIAAGSYVGTGKAGISNPNRVTVGFRPKLLIVYDREYSEYFHLHIAESPSSDSVRKNGTSVSWTGLKTFSVADDGISWYGSSAYAQFDVSGNTYDWVAIG